MKKTLYKVKRKLSKAWINFARNKCIGKRKEVSVSDLYFMQTRGNELFRYDIIVRYLAIEQFYGENTFGWNFYERMQNARKGDGYSEKSISRFHNLIESFKKGYDKDSLITVDKNLCLIDGSHRIALCLYYGIKNVNILIVNRKSDYNYSMDWFFLNGFSKKEIDILVNKEREVREKINHPFSCVIWSPAVPIAHQIIEDISYYGKVMKYKEFSYRPEEYNNIVRAIYAIDDIDKWKIDKKIEHMQKYDGKLVAVDILLDNPDFRLKGATRLPLSRIGERIKKTLRIKYKNGIKDYFFDIIMHIADNHFQSDYMYHVLEPAIKGEDIIGVLNNYKYVICKTDVPYYPADFPKGIPIGKDIDVICIPEDYEAMVHSLIELAERQMEYKIQIVRKPKGTLIRYEMNEHLILQIDVSFAFDKLTNEFVSDAITAGEDVGGYYRMPLAFEYIYRMMAYAEKPSKTHHKRYLEERKADYDEAFVEKYCTDGLRRFYFK